MQTQNGCRPRTQVMRNHRIEPPTLDFIAKIPDTKKMPGLSKEEFQKIYSLWDNVSPIDGDCGLLCSAACCRETGDYPQEICNPEFKSQSQEEDGQVELGMYLLPGEEQMLSTQTPWLTWTTDNPAEYGFPESWTEPVYYAKCSGPANCRRNLRPIQCRTFPLQPHLDQDNRLHLIYYSDALPYKCPLVSNLTKLNQDYLLATFTAWKKLLKDERIFDLVKEDSNYRDYIGTPYTIAYPYQTSRTPDSDC